MPDRCHPGHVFRAEDAMDTGYWIHDGRIYTPIAYSGFWIENMRILGPVGDTGFRVEDDVVFGHEGKNHRRHNCGTTGYDK